MINDTQEALNDKNSIYFNKNLRKLLLSLALLLPILFLAYQTLHLAVARGTGQRVQLRIEGYDPRDLLAGHYLTYRLSLPENADCATLVENFGIAADACLCFHDREIRSQQFIMNTCEDWQLNDCESYIKGSCASGRFIAGIEKYYIPETEARELDQYVRSNGAWIEVVIGPYGKAQVVDLLLK